jgi:REP element-mobilizing transposase RayT
MPRKHLIRNSYFPYHVTARVNNRELFPIPLERVWEHMSTELLASVIKMESQIQAFVLMPNHFHLILTTPTFDLGQTMAVLMRNVTKDVMGEAGKEGRLFQGRYHWSAIHNAHYYRHALKYVYRNPVKAKLCENVEDYAWSTITGRIGKTFLPFPLTPTRTGFDFEEHVTRPYDSLSWLNEAHSAEANMRIQIALMKKIFCPPVNRLTRKPQAIEETAVEIS